MEQQQSTQTQQSKSTQSKMRVNIDAIMEKVSKVLTPAEADQYGLIVKRLEQARDNRNQASRYLDGMNYINDYITNEDNKNTYLTPRVNDTEVRINPGTAEKKLDTIRNEFLTMDFVPEVKAFDEHDLLDDFLSEDITNIIFRIKKQERNPFREDSDYEAMDDMIAQRASYRQTYMHTETLNGKTTHRIQNRAISGLKVFPGSMSMSPYLWNLQPFIVLYDRLNYSTAKALYGHYDNFKYIIPTKGNTQEDIYIGQQFDYRFDNLSYGEVEIVTYESVPDNEYQILINGIPMLAPGTELPWSYPGYDVQIFVGKTLGKDYLLGRPFTAMAKNMSFVQTETLRLLMRKFQQAIEPPVGTAKKDGKTYSSAVWDPSAITHGVTKNTFEKLIDHDGITQSEYNLYNLIEQKTEEFIGANNIAQGLQGGREMSATEILTMQKNFIKQLGYLVAARVRMENVITEQMIYWFVDNYLSPVKKKMDQGKGPVDVYRSFTIEDAVLENKQFGKKVIFLVAEDVDRETLENAYEFQETQRQLGNNIRISFLNINKMKEYHRYWYVRTEVREKQGTALDKVMFQEQLNQGALVQQVTQTPLAAAPIIEAYERTWKARDWFQRKTPLMQEQQEPNQEVVAQAQEIGAEIDALTQNSGSTPDQVREGLRGAAIGQANQVDAATLAAS